MAETTAPMNIYQKLARIGKPVEVLQKNKAGYGYKYVTDDIILASIKGLMRSLGVSLIPRIVPGTTVVEPYPYTKTKTTRDGKVYEEKVNEVLVHCDMEWHWVDTANPTDRIVVPWAMVGQQSDASQAFGSGLSYSSRYFLLKYFNISTTEDDPDNWRSKKKEAEDQENREAAAQIVAIIHQIVQAHLAEHPEAKDSVVEVIKHFAKDKAGKPCANYNNITDPIAAAQLLEELNKLIGADT